MNYWMVLAAALVLGGCAAEGGRGVGSMLDPVCTPDGAVVIYQIPNSQGSYEGVQASRENCPWNQ